MSLQILSNTPPGAQHRLMMALLFARETENEKTIVKVFSIICKWLLLMSLRLFCQQWRAHMVPGFQTPARHMERRLLPDAVVRLL